MSSLKKPPAVGLFFPPSYPEVVADTSDAYTAGCDLLAIAVPESAFTADNSEEGEEGGEAPPVELGQALTSLDSEKLNGLLAALAATGGFKAKEGSVAKGPWVGGAARTVALAVIGKTDNASSTKVALKAVGKQLAAAASAAKCQTMRVVVWEEGQKSELAKGLDGLATGLILSGSEAASFRKKDAKQSKASTRLEKVFIHTADAAGKTALKAGEAYAKGTLLARYLVDAPPNVCTPSHIAEAARQVQQAASDVFELEVLEKDECSEMGLYLGVAECSLEPPKFIHLTYRSPGDGNRKVIGVVGKGLTFDSGGYNLKVGGLIEIMKFDMGGAGATFGAAHIIGQLKPPGLEIHFISASCENMISGQGMRPGDVLSSANGKTVEVDNTDAEGRLTLADALWFAQEKCGVTKVVDIATLTGACMVALGPEIGGLFSPDQEMADALKTASKDSGEEVWQMPMHDKYWNGMKSDVADMKNTGGRMGGAITAALFLKQYVEVKKIKWAHLDIAGPAWGWNEKPARATGFGAELLAKWAIGEGSSPA